MSKIKPVKLVKPIHTVITIDVKTFFKSAGHTCSSGRLTVNFDDSTTIFNPVTDQSAATTICQLLNKAFQTFEGFEKYRGVSTEGLLEVGILRQVSIEAGKYRYVVQFGRKCNGKV